MSSGRPRSEAARLAILVAARDELSEHGYDKFAIDRVAVRAGVSKPTVYRRYPSKNALVAECLLNGFVMTPAVPVSDGGDVRQDVTRWMRDFATVTARPHAAGLIRAAAAAAAEDQGIARAFQQQMTMSREGLSARLRSGAELGQVRPETPSADIAETVVGALIYRLFTHDIIDADYVDTLSAVIFDGLSIHANPDDGDVAQNPS